MHKLKILVSIAIVVAIFTLTRFILTTNQTVETQQLKVKTHQQEREITEQRLEAVWQELEEAKGDSKRLDKLQKEQESIIEDLERQLQAKLDRQSQSSQNAVYASPQAITATQGCEQLGVRLSGLGVSSGDMSAALFIAQKESGCASGAVNASSGACGEFQSLPCGKWGSPGTDTYLTHAINYANSRYGGWQGAYNFWIANHWW